MNFEQAIKRPFLNVKKLIIGILLSIIPIINLFSLGYILECANVKKKKIKGLPEWKNFGNLFLQGLLGTITWIIYLIPALLVVLIGAGKSISELIKTLIKILPAETLESVAAGQTSFQVIEQTIQNNATLLMPFVAEIIPFIIIAGILVLIATYLFPAGIMNYLSSNRFSDILAFNKIFKKSLNGEYFVAWIVTIVVFIITSIIASVIFFFSPALANGVNMFIGGVIAYTLLGEAYNKIKV